MNYIALSGLLSMMRTGSGRPVAPLNIAGDYAGGGMILALG